MRLFIARASVKFHYEQEKEVRLEKITGGGSVCGSSGVDVGGGSTGVTR